VRSAIASSSIVSDASLVVDALVREGARAQWAAEQLASARHVSAPHLLDLEVLAALRKLVSARELPARSAHAAVLDLTRLPIRRYESTRFVERIWELRGQLTAYDAAYVALAEGLGVPVVTMDRRLARAGGHNAEILAFAE
jgi:predicted nucleic acid-binding protein